MSISSSKPVIIIKKIQPVFILILSILLILELGFFKDSLGRYSLSNLLSSNAIKKELRRVQKPQGNKNKKRMFNSYYGKKTFMEKTLLQSKFLEEFLYKTSKVMRRNQENPNKLQQSDIDEMKVSEKVKAKNRKLISQLSTALKFDRNGDLKVDKKELSLDTKSDYFKKQVTKLDLNADGIIDFDEMIKVEENPQNSRRSNYTIQNAESLLKLDPNKDGVLTSEELTKVSTDFFKKYDTDNDNVISESEKKNIIEQLKAKNPRSNSRRYDFSKKRVETKLEIEKGAELHVVGIYEGITNSKGTDVSGPVTKIKVDRPDKKVVLLLNSYRASKWLITTSKNTKISKIILNSYEGDRSKIFLNGKETKAEIFKMRNRPYKTKGSKFVNFKEEVKRRLGRENLGSFTGSYRATKEDFLINKIDETKLLKSNNLETNYKSNELPETTILTKINGVAGNYNLKGELKEPFKKGRLNVDKVAYIKDLKLYYQIEKSGLGEYKDDGSLSQKIDLGLNVPRFSWPKGIAYNKDIHHLAIVTSHVSSYFYDYDLKLKKWTAKKLGRDKGYRDITYDEYNKNYVLISKIYGSSQITLSFLNSDGKLLRKEHIPIKNLSGFEDLYDPDNGPAPKMNIFAKKDHIIITVQAGRRNFSSDTARIYLYDKKTKKVSLTWFAKK